MTAAPVAPTAAAHEQVKTALLHCWMTREELKIKATPGEHCDAFATAVLIALSPPARRHDEALCTAVATTRNGALARACKLDEGHAGGHVDYDGTRWLRAPVSDEYLSDVAAARGSTEGETDR